MGLLTKKKSVQAVGSGQYKSDYEKIFHSLPFIIFTLDRRGRLLGANKHAEEIAGKKLADFKNKSFREFGLLNKKDILIAAREFSRNLLGKITEPTVYTITKPDGKERQVELIGIPIIESGKVARIIDIGWDMTKKYKTEAALKKSEKMYRLITENARDLIAIMSFSLNPKILYLSPSHKRELGYEVEELLGKKIFSIIHPDDKRRIFSLIKKYLANRAKKAFFHRDVSETFEHRVRAKDGRYHYLQSTATFMDKNILTISRDITARKQADEEIKKRNAELERANKLMIGRELKMIELKKKIKEWEE